MCSQIGINSASVNVGFPDLADREESGYILIACLEFSGVEFLKEALTDPLQDRRLKQRSKKCISLWKGP